MRIFDVAVLLSEELQTSPALRIVFLFKDGTRMLVGKSSGAESDLHALRAYPGDAAQELVELEGLACDQAGNLVPDAKKVQRFVPADLIAGFDLIEADPKTLNRVRQAFAGEGRRAAPAPRPAQPDPVETKGAMNSPAPEHLRLAEDGKSQT